jgi:hypothetical protein
MMYIWPLSCSEELACEILFMPRETNLLGQIYIKKNIRMMYTLKMRANYIYRHDMNAFCEKKNEWI